MVAEPAPKEIKFCVSSGCSIANPLRKRKPQQQTYFAFRDLHCPFSHPLGHAPLYQLGTPRDEQALFSGARHTVVRRELAAVMSTSTAVGGEADRPELPAGRPPYRPPLFTWSSTTLAFFAWVGCRPPMPCFPSELLAVSVRSR